MMSRLFIGAVALTGVAVLAMPTQAGVLPPNFLMSWDVSNDGLPSNTYSWRPEDGGFGTLNGFADWTVPESERVWSGWNYTGTLTNSLWTIEWNCVFNEDTGNLATGEGAFVTANIVVTNNSVNTENFSLLMSLPVARPILDPDVSGSIVGTVTDLNFNDATVSAANTNSVYTSLIDTADEVPLMTDPFAVSAGGPLQSNVVGPADFGLPVPIAGSQAVDNSIGLQLNFDLTSGDSASFTAIFEVVPGVGGLPLMALGLFGARRRRRRN